MLTNAGGTKKAILLSPITKTPIQQKIQTKLNDNKTISAKSFLKMQQLQTILGQYRHPARVVICITGPAFLLPATAVK